MVLDRKSEDTVHSEVNMNVWSKPKVSHPTAVETFHFELSMSLSVLDESTEPLDLTFASSHNPSINLCLLIYCSVPLTNYTPTQSPKNATANTECFCGSHFILLRWLCVPNDHVSVNGKQMHWYLKHWYQLNVHRLYIFKTDFLLPKIIQSYIITGLRSEKDCGFSLKSPSLYTPSVHLRNLLSINECSAS